MAGGDAAFEQAWKLIEIEISAKRSKRRGTRVSTFADASDRMAAPAEFCEQRSAVKNRILRTRSGASRSQPGEQREDRQQSFHRDTFLKREWRARQNKTANTYIIEIPLVQVPPSGPLQFTPAFNEGSASDPQANFGLCPTMSALPPKADMRGAKTNVRYGPKTDMMQPHSITSSARAANPGGTSMPSRFAVCANWFTPQQLRRSLTWDRGEEMADHKNFTVATNVQVYFCDPRSPWQRGSNENTNGLLRQYFPKGTDLSRFSQTYLNKIALRLNQRLRKTLGFETPADRLRAVLQ